MWISTSKNTVPVLPANDVFNDYEVHHDFEDHGRRVMLLNARRLDHLQLTLLGIRDITEMYEAEALVRQSEQRPRKMLNIQGVGVLIFNEDSPLIEANDTFLQMSGYSREEIAQGILSWRPRTPPEYVEISEQRMTKLAASGSRDPGAGQVERSRFPSVADAQSAGGAL